MGYLDKNTGQYYPELNTWDSLVLETWDSGLSWQDWTESYTSSVGVPDLTFTTQIQDLGRVAWVNPLCEVISSGTHTIKVYAAESIDSSSALPGDPVIDTSDSTARIDGVYGRYFQFVVEVFDGVGSYLEAINIKLETTEQSETVSGNSATHGGSQTMRLAPITKEYSKLTAVTGHGEATQFIVPLVTVGSLSDATQARYRVWNMIGSAVDSSTVPGNVRDYGFVAPWSPKSISSLGGAQGTDNHYKWSPYSVTLPDNGALRFNGTGVTTGDFNLQAWVKIDTDGGYFFKASGTSPSFDFRVKSITTGSSVEFQYSTNGGSSYTSMGSDTTGNEWHYFYLNKNSNTLTLVCGTTSATPYTGTNNWDMSNATFEFGGNYVGSGDYYVDNIRYSNITRSAVPVPTAEFIVDSDTISLIDVEAQSEDYLIPAVTATDCVVNLVIRGLPKMIVNSAGNIVEQ